MSAPQQNTLDLGTMLFGYNGIPISLNIGIDTMSIVYLGIALLVALLLALLIFGLLFK